MSKPAKNDPNQLWRQVQKAYADFTLAVDKYYELSNKLKGRIAEIKNKKQLQAVRDSIQNSK